MTTALKLAVWNANGLGHHTQEVRLFIKSLDLDILLVSETHFTERSHMSIPNYHIYRTDHPDKTAHGGTAVIIRQKLKHHVRAEYRQEYLQATSIAVEDNLGEITITAAYCPPKHNTKLAEYENFFKTLGHRFIAGGDFNAKNTAWGSRLTTTKGRELLKTMRNNNLQHLTTRQPTYWPSDPNKTPDLLDLCIIRGVPPQKFTVESCLDLTSDHTPILVTMFTQILGKPKRPSLYNKHRLGPLQRYTGGPAELGDTFALRSGHRSGSRKPNNRDSTSSLASYTTSTGKTYSRYMPDTRKTETRRKTQGPENMATHSRPIRQTKIQQAGKGTQTPTTHSQKRRDSTIPLKPDTHTSH